MLGVVEVAREHIPVDVVFWLAFLQEAQGFGEVVVEDDGFVAQLADEQVLLFDFLLEGQGSLELLLRGLELVVGIGECGGGCFRLLPQLLHLLLRAFDQVSKLFLAGGLDLLHGPLQAVDGAGLTVALAGGTFVVFVHTGQLLFQVGHPVGQVASDAPFFHGQDFPVVHGLLGLLELFPQVALGLVHLGALFLPVGLTRGCSGA